MKILFYVPYFPDKIRVRPYNLIKALSESGHKVVVITNKGGTPENDLLNENITILESKISPIQQIINLGVGGAVFGPAQFHFSWNPENFRAAEQQLQIGDFDIVHIEHLRGARMGEALKNNSCRIPVVWDSVDCISELFKLAFRNNHSFMRKMVMGFELIRTPSTEKRLVKVFDRTAVTSEKDRYCFKDLGAEVEKISVIPNGIDLDSFRCQKIPVDEKSIIITGKMSYHANAAMALNMIENIMPAVWAEVPDAKLVIAGKDPTKEILKYSLEPNIEITGEVDDMAEAISSSAVAAAPLKYAVGIQNKILEAMACGKPIVTNTIGNEAIKAKKGDEILTADSDTEFSSSIIQLLNSTELRNNMGEAASKFVRNNFSWKKAADSFIDLYQSAIDG